MTRRRIFKLSRIDGSGGVPQIRYIEDGDSDSKQSDLPLSAEDFTPLAFRLLGARRVGNFTVEFGGQLLWVHRVPAKGDAQHISKNIRLYVKGDQEVINRMLPQAEEEFGNRLQEKLRMAVAELTQEVLAPIYEAAGLTWDMICQMPIYDPSSTSTPRFEWIKREFKDGRISYRKIKGPAGRPSQLEDAELEQRILSAVVVFKNRNHGRPPTRKQVAEELSKLSPIKEPALKMRMNRAGMVWKKMKKVT